MSSTRNGGRIRVVIPSKINARALRLAFLPTALVISTLAGVLGVVEMVLSKHTGWRGWSDLACCALGLIAGELVILFTRRTTVTLTPELLLIEHRTGGYKTKTEKFRTEHLHDLRFVKWERGVDVQNRWNQNEIQFEGDGLLRSFGAGISEPEANVLINDMMRVFPFPSSA